MISVYIKIQENIKSVTKNYLHIFTEYKFLLLMN